MTKFSEYFNSTTIRGRANVAKATYAAIATLYLYNRCTRKNKKGTANSINDGSIEKCDKSPTANGNLEQYKSTNCQCKKRNEKLNERHDLNQVKPSIDTDVSTQFIDKSSTSKSLHAGTHFEDENCDYYLDYPPPDKGA